MAQYSQNLHRWDPIIEDKARQYGVPADLVRAVIWQESRGNPGAVSPVGARGLMQLMPDTAKGLGVTDSHDPAQNIDGGVRYLKQQLDRFGLEGGVAAYNAGPGNVSKYGGVPPFKETQGYVSNILGNYTGGQTGENPQSTPAPPAADKGPSKTVFDQFRAPFDQLRDLLGVSSAAQPPAPAPTQTPLWAQPFEAMKDFYGVGRTLFKGANQAAGDMMQTGTAGLRDFNPMGLMNAGHDIGVNIAKGMGFDTPESKLASLTQNLNAPFSWLADKYQQGNQAAQAEPPTAYEQKYSQPILKTAGGTTIIPSQGELVKGLGTYLPETIMGSSLPAEQIAQQVIDRIGVKTPEVAATLKRAIQSGLSGLGGGLVKGKPDEAALNALTFPLMSLGGEGLSYWTGQASKALKEMWPQIKVQLADETGAIKFGVPKSTPIPETPETIGLQMGALQEGRVPAVLVTPGGPAPEVPKGFQSLETKVGTWIYDPKQLKPFQIKSSVAKGNFGEVLGYVEPIGKNTTQTVSAIQNGVEAKTALVSPENLQRQVQVFQQQFPGAEIKVGGQDLGFQTIGQRALQAPGAEAVAPAEGAQVIPLRPPAGGGGSPPIEPPPPGGPTVERGFTKTVRKSPMTPPEVAQGVSGTYSPITNQGTIDNARAFIAADPIKAREAVLGAREGTPDLVTTGFELMRDFNAKGDFDESIRVANKLAQLATKSGQQVQAYSIYDRLGPDGILRLASKAVQDARDLAPSAKLTQLENKTNAIIESLKKAGTENVNVDAIREQVAKDLKLPNLSPDFAKGVVDRASALQALPEGSRERAIATAQLLRDISELVPSSMLRKVSTLQTMAQLINPKTIIRNVLGNSFFAAGENLKDLAAVPLDYATSIITGKRTRSFAGGMDQLKGFVKGMAEGGEEALKGVDLKLVGDKWEINQLRNGLPMGRTFRGPILGNLERVMNLTLKAPDRAFYQAAFQNTLAEQMSLAGVEKPTDDMIKKAAYEGLYRTFQDDSLAARLFSGIKKALNLGKEFGLGDIVMKYPKTPGNLLSRSMDYSPAGFVHSILDLGKAAMGYGFDQKHFVDMTSRALLGTGGLTAAGYGLAKIGLLRNSAPKDKKVSALERTEGLNQSQLNMTGLVRWVMSGFQTSAAKMQKGDVLATYDWAVPMSVSMSMGARAFEKQNEQKLKKAPVNVFSSLAPDTKDALAMVGAGLEGGVDTLASQPLVTGVSKLFQGQTPAEAGLKTLEGIGASFTPTLLKQITQLSDNTVRDPNSSSPLEMALNLIIQKTPFAGVLPPRRDAFGKPVEAYQDSTNTPFNTMFNPAFVSEYKPTKEAELLLNLHKANSDAKILPLEVEKKFNFHGIPFELDAQQRSDMQKWVGEHTKNFLSMMADNPGFNHAPNEQKLKVLTWYLTNVRERARGAMLNEQMNGMKPEQRLNYLKKIIGDYHLTSDQAQGLVKGIMMGHGVNIDPSTVMNQ